MPILHLTLFILLCVFPSPTIDIFSESLFQHYRLIMQDPYLRIPDPKIIWVDPNTLIRHEYTSRPHLVSLLKYLSSLPPDHLVPLPVVTSSTPRVILDGHHRVAASRIFGIEQIPVWEVNDLDEDINWDTTLVRCYSRTNGERMPLKLVTTSAREGRIDWGIKGTKHVAFIARKGEEIEIELERVTPRIEWGIWKSAGRENASSWDQIVSDSDSAISITEDTSSTLDPLPNVTSFSSSFTSTTKTTASNQISS